MTVWQHIYIYIQSYTHISYACILIHVIYLYTHTSTTILLTQTMDRFSHNFQSNSVSFLPKKADNIWFQFLIGNSLGSCNVSKKPAEKVKKANLSSWGTSKSLSIIILASQSILAMIDPMEWAACNAEAASLLHRMPENSVSPQPKKYSLRRNVALLIQQDLACSLKLPMLPLKLLLLCWFQDVSNFQLVIWNCIWSFRHDSTYKSKKEFAYRILRTLSLLHYHHHETPPRTNTFTTSQVNNKHPKRRTLKNSKRPRCWRAWIWSIGCWMIRFKSDLMLTKLCFFLS